MFLQVCLILFMGGHAWLLWGSIRGCSGGHAWLLRGACMVALGGVHGCYGGHVWLLQGGACMVAPGGACVVAMGGMCGCSGGCMGAAGGHVWLLWGDVWDMMKYGDMINERAVRILLECILVYY